MPELYSINIITNFFYLDNDEIDKGMRFEMVIVVYLMVQLRLIVNFNRNLL